MTKKTIVLNGANLFSGGTLSIFDDCLEFADQHLFENYLITAFVFDKSRYSKLKNITFIEFSAIRKSYFHRIYFEYFHYKKISKALDPYLWFSLNDISSNVVAKIRCVYCHNPAPFDEFVFKDIIDEPRVFIFKLFYKWIYKINIKKNRYVIVQQERLRKLFSSTFDLDRNHIMVAPPKTADPVYTLNSEPVVKDFYQFFFPSFPRPFKNMEVIGQAVEYISKLTSKKFEVVLTIDGSENHYAKRIVDSYKIYPQIKFIGLVDRPTVFKIYEQSDCLLFPSKSETWGLPITEFKTSGKPILLADLPYAKETLGKYDRAFFFEPDNFKMLGKAMTQLMEGQLEFTPTTFVEIEAPFANNWAELFTLALAEGPDVN